MKEDVVISDQKIILFDGVCNLCNSAVNFVIDRDKRDVFRFASLQSELGQKLLRERNIDREKTDSIVLIEPGVAWFVKSSAALEIASHLSGGWKVLSWLKYIIPASLGDVIYDWVASNRYRWFGKQDACRIPTQDLKAKFLDT